MRFPDCKFNLIAAYDDQRARRRLGFSVTTLIIDRLEIEPVYIGDKCHTRAFLISPIIAHYNLACSFPGYCYISFPFPRSSGTRTGIKRKKIAVFYENTFSWLEHDARRTNGTCKTIDLRSALAISQNRSTIENRLKEISFFSNRSKI